MVAEDHGEIVVHVRFQLVPDELQLGGIQPCIIPVVGRIRAEIRAVIPVRVDAQEMVRPEIEGPCPGELGIPGGRTLDRVIQIIEKVLIPEMIVVSGRS
jgi:hypothetical protein